MSLTERWQGKVNGLCGNYDGNSLNDKMLSNGLGALGTVPDFVNSWKKTGQCDDIDGYDINLLPCTVCIDIVLTRKCNLSRIARKPAFRSSTKRDVQPQKIARGLKIRI